MSRPVLRCARCRKVPLELKADYAAYLSPGQTPEDFVWAEEGTLDRETGLFLCDSCYVKVGMPSSPTGWKATPANLKRLGVRP